ncbi:HAD family hydrolase [Yinghuangia aomiensis]
MLGACCCWWISTTPSSTATGPSAMRLPHSSPNTRCRKAISRGPWASTRAATTSRPDVAAALTARYGHVVPAAAIRGLVDGGAAHRVTLEDPVRNALSAARRHGWTCVIVTNGRTAQQETKIRRTGLDRLVQGWVVSEAVGAAKPSPEIFHAAAARVGASVDERTWVVGDSPQADIAGACGLGVASVWVANGRCWEDGSYRPSHVSPDGASAIDHVLRVG